MENKQDIIKKLNSADPILWSEAIDEIKESGDLTIVPDLLDLLLQNPDPDLLTLLTALLADIKDSKFKQLLIAKITTAPRDTDKSHLLRICWESAIDFSEHLDLFVDILLQEDFITALEASTVIENLTGNISEEQLHQTILRLQQYVTEEDKAFLIEDTLAHLEELLQQESPLQQG